MACAVDDQDVVTCLFSRANHFDKTLWRIRCGEIDHIKIKLVGVQTGAAVFGVEHSDFSAHASGDVEGCCGFAAA